MNENSMSGEVHHILYADDALVFCGASEEQVQQVLAILICFEAVSGLKVNLHKYVMYTVGDGVDGQTLASIIGCALGTLPTTYLGLPLGARRAARSLWDPVVSKVRGRLDSWKAKFLSFGGRMTLLKSVLSQLPIYYFSLFQAPVEVLKELERIQNNFLWEGAGGDKRPYLVSWSMVQAPKYRGGLGVLDLRRLNEALLSKWAWRYMTERNSWWQSLIVDKCGVGRSEWRPIWGLQGLVSLERYCQKQH
ncbi:Putative ribonuclease H protein At1g65750 [Linum perenne]